MLSGSRRALVNFVAARHHAIAYNNSFSAKAISTCQRRTIFKTYHTSRLVFLEQPTDGGKINDKDNLPKKAGDEKASPTALSGSCIPQSSPGSVNTQPSSPPSSSSQTPPTPTSSVSNTTSQSTGTKPSEHTRKTTFQNIADTVNYANHSLEEIEKKLMDRVNQKNRRQFRLYFFGSIFLLVVGSYLLVHFFGRDIRKMVSDETAVFAKETLENEDLKIQTKELAMAVVATILNDKEVTAMAASFLRDASTAEETQAALLELVLHVLQHERTLEEVRVLSVKLITALSADKEVQQKIAYLFNQVLVDPLFQKTVVAVVIELLKDPELLQALVDMLVQASQTKDVTDATAELLQTSAQNLLADEEVLNESRKFIANVMGDDSLQKEGGDALWKSLHYALQPGMMKMVGFGLITLSIGAFRLFLSPF